MYKDKLSTSPPAPYVMINGEKIRFSDPLSISDDSLFDWVICKLNFADAFEYDEKSATIAAAAIGRNHKGAVGGTVPVPFPEYFVYLIRPKSFGVSAALEVDTMHDATKELVKVL